MRKILIAAAFILGISQLAYAQHYQYHRSRTTIHHPHYRTAPRTIVKHNHYRHSPRVTHIHHAPPPNYHHYRTAPHYHTIHGDLRRGYRLPPYYRHHQYVITDWRRHNLYAPPRGYHWVQTGANYALVAITTGIIASILLGY